jgi:hypothetical protein
VHPRTASLILKGLTQLMVVGVVVGGVAVVPAGAGAASAPPCTPKVVKINGKQAAESCGPATVLLKISGKTYSFKNGLCEQSKSAGSALQLTLGTVIAGAHGNDGKPDFSMLIAKTHTIASVFEAYSGGKQLLGDSLINPRGTIPSKGTFTGTNLVNNKQFSGSWNCHGVVYKGP